MLDRMGDPKGTEKEQSKESGLRWSKIVAFSIIFSILRRYFERWAPDSAAVGLAVFAAGLFGYLMGIGREYGIIRWILLILFASVCLSLTDLLLLRVFEYFGWH